MASCLPTGRPFSPRRAGRVALAALLAAVLALFAVLSAATPVRARMDAGQQALGLLCSGKPIPGGGSVHGDHCALCAHVAAAAGVAPAVHALDARRSHERASIGLRHSAPVCGSLAYAARAPPARG